MTPSQRKLILLTFLIWNAFLVWHVYPVHAAPLKQFQFTPHCPAYGPGLHRNTLVRI
jgi:hypothetical protein